VTQDIQCPVDTQAAGHLFSDFKKRRSGAFGRGRHMVLSVGRYDDGPAEQTLVLGTGDDTNRGLTTSLEQLDDVPLALYLETGRLMVQRLQQAACVFVIGARLHCQSTLSGRGQHDVKVQDLRDAVRQIEPGKPGDRKDRGVTLLIRKDLAQARIDIASERTEPQILATSK
jgi:hypothetical protein